MIQYATNPVVFADRPWIWVPPSLCIVVTVFCLQFIGDGLRDAMDPKWVQTAGAAEGPAPCRETPEGFPDGFLYGGAVGGQPGLCH